MQKIVFIINRNSIKKQGLVLERAIESRLDNASADITLHYTEYAGHAEILSKEAVENNVDVIVAVGGDGTVNEVAGPIINTEVALGIIPFGSGNGLARHLGIPRKIERALDLLSIGEKTLIDTCRVNNKHFVSIAGVGFDAYVAELFSKGTRRGFLGYFHIIANEFINYKPKSYHLVLANGTQIKQRALFIAFANSNQFGYNTTIAPNATLRDGLMDVCIVQKPQIYKLPLIANLLLLRKLELSPLVKIYKTSSFVLTRSKKRIVNIDGEAIMFGKKLSVKINPLSLKIIINPHVSKV